MLNKTTQNYNNMRLCIRIQLKLRIIICERACVERKVEFCCSVSSCGCML